MLYQLDEKGIPTLHTSAKSSFQDEVEKTKKDTYLLSICTLLFYLAYHFLLLLPTLILIIIGIQKNNQELVRIQKDEVFNQGMNI